MRLPFVSRRRHETAVDFLAAIHRSNLAEALKWAHEERSARRKAETNLAQERKKQRAVASWRYVDDQRLGRAVRALAAERKQAAAYRRTIRQLTDQLLDATGFQGEPLLPAARTTLGITTPKEKA
ncbi:hypothetical protein [Streptomyces sp. NPDC056543]|uniref:hypothetical protein n=1 Tax=unclassified Streptomyces TaxID=2593676 RepID=UPI00368E62FC